MWKVARLRWRRRGQPLYYIEIIDGLPWLFPASGGTKGGRLAEEWIEATKAHGRAF